MSELCRLAAEVVNEMLHVGVAVVHEQYYIERDTVARIIANSGYVKTLKEGAKS